MALKPRQIADRMVKDMEARAGETWETFARDVRAEDRAEIKGLVWSHVTNHFARRYKRRQP